MHAQGQPRTLTALAREERGAIVVFGIFFAVFVLGMLYYMVGLGNAIYYRERLQDAADASAFGAAVVHARGMNTLALINMIMAAVLSILVTLKLVESLIAVAEVVMAVLSIFGGATAGIATALEQLRQQVNQAAETAKPFVMNTLTVLHTLGRVVKVITPIGSNATVLANIAKNYEGVAFAVAIPARITLPVEDDEFTYLCKKSGVMAGSLAMLPLSPILPGFIERAVSGAVGELASSAPGWFCGEPGATPPSTTLPDQVEGRPISREHKDCVEYEPPESGPDQSVDLCRTAERTDMLATPDATTGRCRIGQPVCIPVREDPDDPNSAVATPHAGTYCAEEGASETVSAADCPGTDANGNLSSERNASSAYGRRLQQARADCTPTGTTRAYTWIQRTVHVTYVWNADTGRWVEQPRVEDPEQLVKHGKDDLATPCNIGRPPVFGQPASDATWNAGGDLSKPVCSTEEAAPTVPPIAGQTRIETSHLEVKQVLSCGQWVEGRTITVGAIDMDEIGGGQGGANGEGDGQNRNPFRFEKGHMLGTSDMQIRSLVFGHAITDTGPTKESDHVIDMTRWHEGTPTGHTFLGNARAWGRIAVAQAEYYFDDRAPLESDRFADLKKQRDWLWVMGWTARLRRFRLKWEGEDKNGNKIDPDAPSRKGDSDQDKQMASEMGDIDSLGSLQGTTPAGHDGPSTACGGIAGCDQADGLMRQFDQLFVH